MGIPVLIMGESGSGKTASLRNFDPAEVAVLNVESKPLPFRKRLRVLNNPGYGDIMKALSNPPKGVKSMVIDDSQYLMSDQFFDRAKETGYQKYVDMGCDFRNLLHYIIHQTPPDMIVYLLHHTEMTPDGKYKAKTIGKMLDEKLTVEGLFSIVLLCLAAKDRWYFLTQSQGISTAKSPMEMFPPEIDNDLALVDKTIREYYNLLPVSNTTFDPATGEFEPKKEEK